MYTTFNIKKEKESRAYNAEYLCIARQCVAEYTEKMVVSAKQYSVIKFCVHLKKTRSETTTSAVDS